MILLTDLDVYRLSENLSDLIWESYDSWDEKTQKTVGYQVIRSADSISANIAEGYGRFTGPDRRRFYRYARGSFVETRSWLRKLKRRNIIDETEYEQYQQIINELGPKLNAFIRKTR